MGTQAICSPSLSWSLIMPCPKKKLCADAVDPTDAIILADSYMEQMIAGTKTYESRKYGIRPSVKRIWLYLNAPTLSIKYYMCVGEISQARDSRKPDGLQTTAGGSGIGAKKFNERH